MFVHPLDGGGACRSALGWGTALQVRRLQVWYLMVSLEFLFT